MLWVWGPDVPGIVTTLLKPLGLGLPNRSSKRRLLQALSTNPWGLWGSQVAEQQMEIVFLHRLASSSRFTCEMSALWASVLPHTPETSCQHGFCSYLSQPTFWDSSTASQEQLRSAKNLLWHRGWKWVTLACLSGLSLQIGCSERLFLGCTFEEISCHTKNIWECWQKSKDKVFACLVWVSVSPSMCIPHWRASFHDSIYFYYYVHVFVYMMLHQPWQI